MPDRLESYINGTNITVYRCTATKTEGSRSLNLGIYGLLTCNNFSANKYTHQPVHSTIYIYNRLSYVPKIAHYKPMRE